MADTKQAKVEGNPDEAHVDRILAVSRHADGSPAQSKGFKSIDPERTKALSEAQLREQAASAVDYAARSALVADDTEPGEPDAWVKALKDAQEKAGDAAAKKAETPDKA